MPTKKKHTPSIHSDYLHVAFDLNTPRVKKSIKAMVKMLKTYDFDAIAFRGMSGALIAPILAMLCGKTLIMVRKPKQDGEKDCHSRELVEGDLNAKRYVVVDDFICSGCTMTEIISRVSEFNEDAVCIGVLLYDEALKFGCKPELDSMFRYALTNLERFVAENPEVYKIKNEQKQIAGATEGSGR